MNISIKNLSFSYGNKKVLDDISFLVDSGTLLCIMGSNGVGKTTLFKCILGRNKNYVGEILVDNKKTTDMSSRELASYVAYIPQARGQVFGFSALEVVLMGVTHSLSFFKTPGKKEEEICIKAMEELGIANLRDKSYLNLSGGEQQLVLIARALAQQSKILLMDEPTSALDFGNQNKIMKKVKDLAIKGYIILLTTHNPNHALAYADKVLALHNMKIEAYGNTNEVINKNLIKKLYDVDTQIITSDSQKNINHNYICVL